MDQFSNDFASHWDELVGWEKRSAADTEFLLSLIKKFGCASVLDAALGTGFHSVKLLQAGLRVKSVDISPAMIEVAKNNAARNGTTLDVVCADWVNLTQKVPEKFDCVICLGNSLACEMDTKKREVSIQNWSDVLNDGGIVIADRRNYEAILSNEYNNNSKGQYFGDTVKITFSKITPDETIFSYTFSDGRTFSLTMFPILETELKQQFAKANMKPVEIYGDRKIGHMGTDVAFYLYVFKKTK